MNDQENKNSQLNGEYVTTYYVYPEGETEPKGEEKQDGYENKDRIYGDGKFYLSPNEENERVILEKREREEYMQKRKYNRAPLMLSLIGMMLSVFCGIGIALAIPSFITSILRLRVKPSKPLKWALIISAVTIFVSAIIIVCFSYALVTGLVEYLKLIEEGKEAVLRLIYG